MKKIFPENSAYPISFSLCLFLSIGIIFFGSTGRDDSHISFFPAWTLSEYGEILNYNGERIEQSSSLLFVLVLAVYTKFLPLPIPDIALILSVKFGLLACYFIYQLSTKIKPNLAALAIIATASSAHLIYWAFSGMETSLVALLAVMLVISVGDSLSSGLKLSFLRSSLVMLGFLLSRPESPFILFAILFGLTAYMLFDLVLYKNKSFYRTEKAIVSRILFLFLVFVILQSLIFVFRYTYFSALFPQPVYAKVGGLTSYKLLLGLQYSVRWFLADWRIIVPSLMTITSFILAVFSILRGVNRNLYLILIVLLVLAQTSFVIFTGGDWMELARFYVPILPLMSIFMVYIFQSLSSKYVLVSIIFIISLQLLSVSKFVTETSMGQTLPDSIYSYQNFATDMNIENLSWAERTNLIHMRDIPASYHMNQIISQLLTVQENVTLLSSQAGMVLYHSATAYYQNLRFIDMRALVDNTISNCNFIMQRAVESSVGISFDTRLLFSDSETLETDCNISSADIYLELGIPNDHPNFLADYQPVFMQGDFEIAGKMYVFATAQFISVRRDLIPYLSEEYQNTIELSNPSATLFASTR